MEIYSHIEMKSVAKKLLNCLPQLTGESKGALLLLLRGDLGTGKTTFVQALAVELGVQERVTSPTFVIQKHYELPLPQHSVLGVQNTFKMLVHIDAYRLSAFSELESLGWADFISDSQTIVALEWPERVMGGVEHARSIEIEFSHTKENARTIFFRGNDRLC